ncbi:MAG: glycosyltransferase family 4 protein [Acidobacteriota bacterium]
MTRVGVLVGENNWLFVKPIYDDLVAHFHTTLFQPKRYRLGIGSSRVNRWAHHRGLRALMGSSDVCFFEWASELLAEASRLPKCCRIVVRLHSFELYTWASQINWKVVDKIILVSRAMQRAFSELYPEHAHKTVVINNGVSLKRFEYTGRREFAFRLGMLCNLVAVKRVYEMILLLSRIREAGHNATLRIGGKPDSGELRYAAALYRLVKELRLQGRVEFDGYIADTSLWLQNVDIFVSHSYWEGQQVALLEAMASGCYCVAHCWAGAEEVLPEANLYVQEAELEEKVIQYSRMAVAQRKVQQKELRLLAVSRFDIEQTKAAIRQIIKEVGDWGHPSCREVTSELVQGVG